MFKSWKRIRSGELRATYICSIMEIRILENTILSKKESVMNALTFNQFWTKFEDSCQMHNLEGEE